LGLIKNVAPNGFASDLIRLLGLAFGNNNSNLKKLHNDLNKKCQCFISVATHYKDAVTNYKSAVTYFTSAVTHYKNSVTRFINAVAHCKCTVTHYISAVAHFISAVVYYIKSV